MKKITLLSLLLLCSLTLIACDKKTEENVNETNTEVIAVNSNCVKAVENYLAWADQNGQWEEIKTWDNIVVDYVWRLKDGTVFDTSIESIARACDSYSEYRDYTQWLPFEVWAGQMIVWFDNWVVWMKLWQTKTIEFWPEEWYGEYDESLIMTAPIDEVGDISGFSEWDTVYLWMWYPAKIAKITDKDVSFDMNHELAGKDLIFDVTIKSIN